MGGETDRPPVLCVEKLYRRVVHKLFIIIVTHVYRKCHNYNL